MIRLSLSILIFSLASFCVQLYCYWAVRVYIFHDFYVHIIKNIPCSCNDVNIACRYLVTSKLVCSSSIVAAVYDGHVGNHARFVSHDVVYFIFSYIIIRMLRCALCDIQCIHNCDTFKTMLASLLSLLASQDTQHHEQVISRMDCHALLSQHHSGTSVYLSWFGQHSGVVVVFLGGTMLEVWWIQNVDGLGAGLKLVIGPVDM